GELHALGRPAEQVPLDLLPLDVVMDQRRLYSAIHLLAAILEPDDQDLAAPEFLEACDRFHCFAGKLDRLQVSQRRRASPTRSDQQRQELPAELGCRQPPSRLDDSGVISGIPNIAVVVWHLWLVCAGRLALEFLSCRCDRAADIPATLLP